MSRWWNEFVAAVGDVIPLPLLSLLLLAAGRARRALWYLFRLVPALACRRRWPALAAAPAALALAGGWRLAVAPRAATPAALSRGRGQRPSWPDEELPELPAATFVDARRPARRRGPLRRGGPGAAARDGARADRARRHRAPSGLDGHRAGRAAAAPRGPPSTAPLGAAGGVFSDIWYGQRPARAEHDARMRALAGRPSHAARSPSRSAVTA